MQNQKLKTNTIAANREIAIQKIKYDFNGVISEQEVEWKNYDAFGVSDLRTRKKASETAVTGMDYDAMELDPVGLEVRSRQTNQGGGGTIDPEIPMLQNLPEPGAPGGDPDYHGAGGGGIGQLCDIGGPVAVLCGRIQFVDGFGRSGRFASLERNFYYSNQPTGYLATHRNAAGEIVKRQEFGADVSMRRLWGAYWEGGAITAIYNNWNFADFLGQTNTKDTWYMPSQPDVPKEINEILEYSYREECTKAFKDAGLKPPSEIVSNTIFVTEDVFSVPEFDKFWTQNSDIGEKMRTTFQENKNTKDLAWPGEYENTGFRFIGITNSATSPKSTEHLSVVLIHALIHATGKSGKKERSWYEWIMRINSHDLRYVKNYKEILKNCTKEGGSNELWGQ